MPRPSQCGVCGMFELCFEPDHLQCAERVDSPAPKARPYYAPFAPADPKSCTCVDPFSCCPIHG
jgi:hypothetical protein